MILLRCVCRHLTSTLEYFTEPTGSHCRHCSLPSMACALRWAALSDVGDADVFGQHLSCFVNWRRWMTRHCWWRCSCWRARSTTPWETCPKPGGLSALTDSGCPGLSCPLLPCFALLFPILACPACLSVCQKFSVFLWGDLLNCLWSLCSGIRYFLSSPIISHRPWWLKGWSVAFMSPGQWFNPWPSRTED